MKRLLVTASLFVLISFNPFASAQAQTSSDITPQQDAKASHDGSIRDLDAIGNRNVGCGRGVGNWYTLEKQVAEGKSYAQRVESSAKLINAPVVTEYVNRLGQNLVRNSDARVPFTIKVIDSDEVNAFALPGGFLYVNSGLLLAADNEAEVAGVMAHEIAHVAACHAARQQSRSQLAQLASIPLIFVGGGIGYAAIQAANIAVPMTFLKFTRGFESQADYLGIEYMYKAGYDPQAFPAFFEKIQSRAKHKPGTIAKVFATHPPTPDRMRKAQEEIAKLPARREYVLDTSEFEEVKSRLSAIEDRHRIVSEKDRGRPTLRRAEPKGNNKSEDDNGRPTLKRRGPDTSDD
ncbi:MAG: M48 family metallopeptidase [Terriglobales bacterium]